MFSIEPLFCPCCTPAILHTLAQSDLTRVPQQMLWLGTGALSAVIKRHQPEKAIDLAKHHTNDIN